MAHFFWLTYYILVSLNILGLQNTAIDNWAPNNYSVNQNHNLRKRLAINIFISSSLLCNGFVHLKVDSGETNNNKIANG